jgi:hypothetical protein
MLEVRSPISIAKMAHEQAGALPQLRSIRVRRGRQPAVHCYNNRRHWDHCAAGRTISLQRCTGCQWSVMSPSGRDYLQWSAGTPFWLVVRPSASTHRQFTGGREFFFFFQGRRAKRHFHRLSARQHESTCNSSKYLWIDVCQHRQGIGTRWAGWPSMV